MFGDLVQFHEIVHNVNSSRADVMDTLYRATTFRVVVLLGQSNAQRIQHHTNIDRNK